MSNAQGTVGMESAGQAGAPEPAMGAAVEESLAMP